ncbi:Hypothetical predicted protein [Mytilus galloprovincialis]|uniref:DDE Tnp4 domain-containing protein n=1 Tax=Mytilus galloprovincialis TaxID=29158 RepID=A0A8B6C5U3_MYTGA|nr:Hypothetical predicted protein [Mytilus galloprovincialis]
MAEQKAEALNDDEISGYLVEVSPIKTSQQNNKYFDGTINSNRKTFQHFVCFDVSKHSQFRSAGTQKSPVKLQRISQVPKFSCKEQPKETSEHCTLEKIQNLPEKSKLFGIKENELAEVARHMGHELAVHRQYYRLQDDVIELAKVSKLLLAVESGKANSFRGMSIDDIDIDGLPNVDDYEEIESTFGRFTNLVARWSGSAHDIHMLRTSNIRTVLERDNDGLQNGIRLGNSGYACKSYLITLYMRPSDQSKERYNGSHCRTRVTIERAFCWLKRCFHCLHGEIRMHHERAFTIIAARRCKLAEDISHMETEERERKDDTKKENQPTVSI